MGNARPVPAQSCGAGRHQRQAAGGRCRDRSCRAPARVLPCPTVAATTVAATQDTYTDASQPTTNFGSKPYLRVDGSPVLNAYLQFDVPSGTHSQRCSGSTPRVEGRAA